MVAMWETCQAKIAQWLRYQEQSRLALLSAPPGVNPGYWVSDFVDYLKRGKLMG